MRELSETWHEPQAWRAEILKVRASARRHRAFSFLPGAPGLVESAHKIQRSWQNVSMKRCSKCRTRRRRAIDQRYCKKCHNAYQLAYGPSKYANLGKKQKKKSIARVKANVYQRRGKLKKPSRCEGCGKRRKLEKHHEDYSKALNVIWLCNPCHVER